MTDTEFIDKRAGYGIDEDLADITKNQDQTGYHGVLTFRGNQKDRQDT